MALDGKRPSRVDENIRKLEQSNDVTNTLTNIKRQDSTDTEEGDELNRSINGLTAGDLMDFSQKTEKQLAQEDVEVKVVNYSFGYGKCTPKWLQCCNSSKIFLVYISWFTIVQGFVVNGINNVNTTSVERRFNLPSSRVGLISSSYDISAGLLVLFISYYGAHGHKPKWLAAASFIMSCGSFIMALPHLTTPQYQLREKSSDVCLIGDNSTSANTCKVGDSYLPNYLYVLILGQLLHGVGGTTLYTLGTAFMDDNVKTKVSPVYIGVMHGCSALGPALGYVIGGQFVDNLYVDFDTLESGSGLDSSDPRWVGAWWLGFVIASVLFLTVTLAMSCYPRELPSAEAAKKDRALNRQTHANGGEEKIEAPGFGTSIRDLPKAVKIILKNPTFIFVTLAACSEGFATSGLATFLPKIIQNQFSQKPGWAAMLTGFIAVPGAAGGQLIGGIICTKMKLKVRGMLRLSIICCIISGLSCFTFWIRCDTPPLIGVNVPYQNESMVAENNITSFCNSDCACTTQSYEPICHNQQQYFSPCHAGCLTSQGSGSDKVYGNCSCIPGDILNNGSSIPVKEGPCDNDCIILYVLFLPLAFILVVTTFVSTTPGTSVTLRCVPDSQRTFGLGMQWVFIRFLSTVPGPIIFGAIIDSTCLLWQERCGEEGSCWLYDNKKMSLNFFILGVAIKIVSTIFFSLAHWFYKPPENVANSVTLKRLTSEQSASSESSDRDSSNEGKVKRFISSEEEEPPSI